MKINFFLKGNHYRIRNKNNIRRWLEEIRIEENSSVKEVSVILTSDKNLLRLNKEFLNHDYFTDVITFTDIVEGIQKTEIYISIDRVKANAKIYKNTTNIELRRIIVHGFLHASGYNDASIKEKKHMTILEDKYLAWYIRLLEK